MLVSPTNPGNDIYELNWENEKDRSTLPGGAPEGWAKEYDPNRQADAGGDGEPAVRVAHSPNEPVRGGQWSARFELSKGDEAIGANGKQLGKRAELSVDGFEDEHAERWYGFSIYLPETWVYDKSPEIVTQWHQDWHEPGGGSPPLAIMTHEGLWKISLKKWDGTNDTDDIPLIGYETGRWTDWVVHVRWSEGDGLLDIWKDGHMVFQKSGQNAYAGWGNYMKIGIYKWQWGWAPDHKPPSPSTTTKRVLYHDQVRIAAGPGDHYEDVAPRFELSLRRTSLQNVDDAAGRWQFEGGQAFSGGEPVANYASSKRVVFGGTDTQNTAMLTTTLFFLGSRNQPPENITLQGSHDFNSGNRIGSVSAASAGFAYWIGRKFTQLGDVLKIG